MENSSARPRSSTAGHGGKPPQSSGQTNAQKTEHTASGSTTSAYSKARISRSRSVAKQDIESWATGGMKGHVHLLRNSGFLVSNIVEDRALECKLWDLARERQSYLRFQERERALFLERLKLRSGGVMRELVSYIELGKTPRRRNTHRNLRPATAATSHRSTSAGGPSLRSALAGGSSLRSASAGGPSLRSASAKVVGPSPQPAIAAPSLRPITAAPSIRLLAATPSTSPSTSPELQRSTATRSSHTESEHGDVELKVHNIDTCQSMLGQPKRAGLSKSAQPLTRVVGVDTTDAPIKEHSSDVQPRPPPGKSTIRPFTAAPDHSRIPQELSLKYPGRRFIPMQLASQGFKSVHAPLSTLISSGGITGSTSSQSSVSINSQRLKVTEVGRGGGIDAVLSRSLCFSDDAQSRHTVEHEEVARLIDGVDSLRAPSTNVRRTRLRSATTEFLLREIFSH